MYERYTESARRAVFFCTWYARLRESGEIDSVDLLRGLMHDDNSRANTIFHLREYFPLYCGCPSKFATADEVPKTAPFLINETKRILAWTQREADAMRDYWIDTEHMLVGILLEPRCIAAKFLARTGLTIEGARSIVLQNKASRPEYGPIPDGWLRPSRLRRLRSWGGVQ